MIVKVNSQHAHLIRRYFFEIRGIKFKGKLLKCNHPLFSNMLFISLHALLSQCIQV